MANPESIPSIVTAVGYSVWQLQMLEESLVTHITLLHDVAPGLTKERLAAALGARRRLTFGQLLGALGTVLAQERTLDEALERRLAAVKAERNWLVHHSQREAYVKSNSAEGAREVMARLDALMADTVALSDAVQAATERVLAARGHLRQSFRQDVAAIAEAWARGERHPGEVDT